MTSLVDTLKVLCSSCTSVWKSGESQRSDIVYNTAQPISGSYSTLCESEVPNKEDGFFTPSSEPLLEVDLGCHNHHYYHHHHNQFLVTFFFYQVGSICVSQ